MEKEQRHVKLTDTLNIQSITRLSGHRLKIGKAISVIQFYRVCAHCSLRFLLVADESGT